jgi:RNA polymerase subunit RPABC4/transcription elongation factor Spt4
MLRLNEEEGMTKTTAWRMMMLKEHESSSGVPCVKCGSFLVEDEGCCTHCEIRRFGPSVTARCPVCQDSEIPKAFFDPKMRSELERVEKARAALFQPRRLMLVKA